MNCGLDLNEIHIEDSLLQAMERSFTQLEMALKPRPEEPMVFDLGISTLTLKPELFDRLVDRCIVSREDNPGANTFLSPEDTDLQRMGLLEIKNRNEWLHSIYYHTDSPTNSPTTSTAIRDVSITHTGRVVLKLAGTMPILESVIRQGLFSVLEALLNMIDIEWLPELLSHKAPRVRKLASERLTQLEEE